MSVLATFPTWWCVAPSCVKSGGCFRCLPEVFAGVEVKLSAVIK